MRRPASTVASTGSTTSAVPIACIALIMSTAPPPKPPASSENGIDSTPNSASCFHTASLEPVSEWTIFLRCSKSYWSFR